MNPVPVEGPVPVHRPAGVDHVQADRLLVEEPIEDEVQALRVRGLQVLGPNSMEKFWLEFWLEK